MHSNLNTVADDAAWYVETLLYDLQVGGAITCNQSDHPSENYRTNNGNNNADDKTVLPNSTESDELGQESSESKMFFVPPS